MNVKQKAKHLLTLSKKCADASIITADLVQTITGTYKLEGESAPGQSDKNKWDHCIDTIHDHMEDQEILIRTTYPLHSRPNNYYVWEYTDRLIIPIKCKTIIGKTLYSARLVFFPQVDVNCKRWTFTVSDPGFVGLTPNEYANRYAWGYSLDKIADIASKAKSMPIDHDLIKPAFEALGKRLLYQIAETHKR